MKRVLFIGIIYIASVLAQASESDASLILGTVNNFPPFTYMQDDKLVGVDIDLVNEMSRRLGIHVEYQILPWARVISSLKNGAIDGGFAAFETKERQGFCLYTGVLHYEEFYLFVKKGREFTYNGIKDLYGKSVGKDYGVYVNKEFEQAVAAGKIELHQVSDMNMVNIKKLHAERLDTAIGDLGVMMYYADAVGLGGEVVPLKPISPPTPAFLVLSKKSGVENKEYLQKKMKETLAEMWKDGSYNKFMRRHIKASF